MIRRAFTSWVTGCRKGWLRAAATAIGLREKMFRR